MSAVQKWYAVYTKPKSEKKLQENLRKIDIPTYLPLLAQKRKWSDRVKTVEMPVFPSYLFVFLDYEKDSLKVLKDSHSVNFVTTSGTPCEIASDDIEMVKLFIESYPEKVKLDRERMFQKGRKVCIRSGPFAGKTAVIEKVKNSYYVIVNIPAVNSALTMEIAKENIDEFL